jgi:hypothetical protein
VSVWHATLGCVEVTAADIARIRQTNLHVPVAEFVTFWAAAEAHRDRRPQDWYVAGVIETLRWLAGAHVQPRSGPEYLQWAPVTRRRTWVYEEIIETECLKAEVLDMRRPVPRWLEEKPGWLAGVLGTLNWAWRRTAGLPLDLDQRATG